MADLENLTEKTPLSQTPSDDKPVEASAPCAENTEQQCAVNRKRPRRRANAELAKCVLVLVAIALVSGVLLGIVHKLTYTEADDTTIMQLAANEYGVGLENVGKRPDMLLNREYSTSSVSAVYQINDGEGIAGYAYFATGKGGYKGDTQFIIFVSDGKIRRISVFSHSETASIGGKVLKDGNISALNGALLSELTDYGDVTAAEASEAEIYITGATKTARAVLNAVRAAAYAYNTFFDGGNADA
jgi:Na+-translocating ferredoxin:NAD+ oxidoreductase RnfG subunit